jgi:hypothetical protein
MAVFSPEKRVYAIYSESVRPLEQFTPFSRTTFNRCCAFAHDWVKFECNEALVARQFLAKEGARTSRYRRTAKVKLETLDTRSTVSEREVCTRLSDIIFALYTYHNRHCKVYIVLCGKLVTNIEKKNCRVWKKIKK